MDTNPSPQQKASECRRSGKAPALDPVRILAFYQLVDGVLRPCGRAAFGQTMASCHSTHSHQLPVPHVTVQHGDVPKADSGPRADKPLCWAIDAHSRRVVHVSMLERAQKGLACGCVCPGCGAELEAVNAGRDLRHFSRPNTLGQFFRHGRGHQKDNCLLLAARFAALQSLYDQGEIELPAARRSVAVQGASGQAYLGDYARGRAAIRVRARAWIDAQSARLTLEDGKVVLLRLESSFQATEDGHYDGVITIHVDDPAIASWSADEILSQARLGGALACWSWHWDDNQAEIDAHEHARRQAIQALDLDPTEDLTLQQLTAAQHSESILHRTIKVILAEAGSVSVPAYAGFETSTLPAGTVFTERFSVPAEVLRLSDVRLEHRMGNMVPDVYCEAHTALRSFALMVEVVVTHQVDEQKLDKIRERGVACLALDISRLREQGTMMLTRLRSEVLLNPHIKVWLFDPRLEVLRTAAKRKLHQQVATARKIAKSKEDFLVALRSTAADRLPRFVLSSVLEYARDVQQGGEAQSRIDLDAIGEILRREEWGIQQPAALLQPGGILCALSAIRAAAGDTPNGSEAAVAYLKHFASDGALRSYISLLLIAFKTYAPWLDQEEQACYAGIHAQVHRSLEQLEYGFARSQQFDSLIATLFPEIAARLEHSFGTTAHVRELSRQRAQALAVERERREAIERAEAAQRAKEAELRELQAEIDRLAAIQWQPAIGFMVDAEQALATSYLKDIARSMQYRNVDVARVLRSAFAARAQGTTLGEWISSLTPTSIDQINGWLTVVRAAWMVADRPR